MAQTLKEDVRTRILAAAEEMMMTCGSALTMRQIAHAAGVTPGNLYRYYAGKEELLAAVTRPVLDGLDALVRRHSGDLLRLGQTSFALPVDTGPSGLAQLRGELYRSLVPALAELCALAGQYPRPMAILCQQNEVNQSLMDWFYGLIHGALEQLLQMTVPDGGTLKILVEMEGQSFCQGVITLMQKSQSMTEEQQRELIQCFLAIQIEGILWVIQTSVENGEIEYKGESKQ